MHGDCGSAISQAQALLLSAKTTNGPSGGGRAVEFPQTPSLTQRHLAIFASSACLDNYRKDELIFIFSIVGAGNFICCMAMGYDGVTAAPKARASGILPEEDFGSHSGDTPRKRESRDIMNAKSK